MKLVSVNALLRFSVPEDTTEEQLQSIVENLCSDSIPTLQNAFLTAECNNQLSEFGVNQRIDHVNVWVKDNYITE